MLQIHIYIYIYNLTVDSQAKTWKERWIKTITELINTHIGNIGLCEQGLLIIHNITLSNSNKHQITIHTV